MRGGGRGGEGGEVGGKWGVEGRCWGRVSGARRGEGGEGGLRRMVGKMLGNVEERRTAQFSQGGGSWVWRAKTCWERNSVRRVG